MDILEHINTILEQQNNQEKQRLLAQLSQVLEMHHGLNEADIIEGVKILLVAGLQENDPKMRERLFHAIYIAVATHSIQTRINWDRLAASLSTLGKDELEYVMEILGISGQARYLPILEEYIHNADPEIREWAQDAVKEVHYQIARAADAQDKN